MRKLSTLALACVFALGTVCSASAIDVKVGGTWDFTFGWADNISSSGSFVDKDKHGSDDDFVARHRVRTQIDFIASENLSATLLFEIGNLDWGRGGASGRGSGGALDADGVNIETKRAHLDWIIPNTDVKIRMGIQGFHLPWAYGGPGANPLLSNDGTGITVSTPIVDGLGITAFWLRAFDAYEYDENGKNKMDETDIFGITLPITAIDGVRFVPYGVYAAIGADSGFWEYGSRTGTYPTSATTTANRSTRWNNTDTHAWYAGFALNVNVFDPLTFSVDAMYGSLDGSGGINNNPGSDGWLVASALRYKLDWGTPGLFGWYASGDDDDAIKDGEFGRLPALGYDWGAGFTSFGFDGGDPISTDTRVSVTGVGTWGIGLEIAKMTFVEDLSHTIRFAYYAGTNDADLVKNNAAMFGKRKNNALYLGDRHYMTDEDYAFEVNFDSKYQIYENLSATLELGYIHMDMDSGTWKNTDYGHKTDDAWKAQLNFQFKF